MIKKLTKIFIIIILLLFSSCLISKVSAKNWVERANYQADIISYYCEKHEKYNIACWQMKMKRYTGQIFNFHMPHLDGVTEKSLSFKDYNEQFPNILTEGILCGQHDENFANNLDSGRYSVDKTININISANDGSYMYLIQTSKNTKTNKWQVNNFETQTAFINGMYKLAYSISNLQLDLARLKKNNSWIKNNPHQHLAAQIGVWKYAKTFYESLNNYKDCDINFTYSDSQKNLTEYLKDDYINKVVTTAGDYEQFVANNTELIYDYDIEEKVRCFKEPKQNFTNISAKLTGNRIIIGPLNLFFVEGKSTRGEYFAGISDSNVPNYSYQYNDTRNFVVDMNKRICYDIKFCDSEGKEIEPHSNENFYISVPESINGIKYLKLKNEILGLRVYFDVIINSSKNQMQFLIYNGEREYSVKEIDIPLNLNFTGNLIVTKQDQYKPAKRLAGVEFKIMNPSGQYIRVNNQSRLTGITIASNVQATTEANATTFVTDNEGMFGLFNIMIGQYTLKEISVGSNDRYAVKSTTDKVSVTPQTTATAQNATYKTPATNLIINNKLRYIKVSGTVWNDLIDNSKDTSRNYLLDSRDKRLEGIPVKIKDKQGNVVRNAKGELCETETGENGTYSFDYLDVEQFANYTVEFEYNGMKYEAIKYESNKLEDTYRNQRENSSKVADTGGTGIKTRGKLNLTYGTVTQSSDIEYKDGAYESKVVYEGDAEYYGPQSRYSVLTDTRSGAYDLSKYYDPANDYDHMQYINFGMVEREQPDLALKKDIDSVRVEINGKIHIYRYADRFDNIAEYGDAYKIPQTIKFQKNTKYGGMTYTRSVYASDVLNVENKGEKAKEEDKLKVNVIYRVEIKNQSTSVNSVVNEIAEYYDTKYEGNNEQGENIIAGLTLDKTGKVNKEITVGNTENTKNEEYKKVILKPNLEIEAGKEKSIYIMLQVTQEGLKEVTKIGEDNSETEFKLDNILEITSYTTKKDGQVIAGIDIDSRPENADIDKISNPEKVKEGQITTYEDDTDRAPGFILQLNAPRQTKGKVFLDSIEKPENIDNTNNLMTNEERKGNGKFDSNNEDEKGIEGVVVELIDKEGQVIDTYTQDKETKKWKWKPSTTTTNKNGEYTFVGYIPGDYRIKFTWGDGTYKVQSYKGTIYVQEREDKTNNVANTKYNAQEETQWYKKDGDNRYSDAIDNYNTRIEIDKQTNEVTNKNQKAINDSYIKEGVKIGEKDVVTKMDSYTPIMDVRIEYNDSESSYTTEDTSSEENKIENIDFGIVERPRQEISLEKRVKRVILKLANGATLIDAEVEKDKVTGEYRLKEEINNTVYLSKTEQGNGMLKLEIDKEIVQGATLEIEYEFVIENISELDYTNEEYYKYGKNKAEKDIVKLTPKEIIEYLDNQTSVDENQERWVKENDIEKLYKDGLLNKEELGEYLKNLERIYTKEIKDILKPNDKSELIEFKTSKILANSEDITIGNNAEIIKLTKTGGSTLVSTPGNYNPSKAETYENDSGLSEDVIVIPPTGANKDYITYSIIGILSLGIIAVGAILIKKKILN